MVEAQAAGSTSDSFYDDSLVVHYIEVMSSWKLLDFLKLYNIRYNVEADIASGKTTRHGLHSNRSKIYSRNIAFLR